MSDFRFGCPHCGQRITGDAGYRGLKIQCPSCKNEITVPAPPGKAPVPAPARPAPASGSHRLSALALVSLVSAAVPGLGSIGAILCGHMARRRIRRDPTLKGRRLATTGIVLGYSFLVLTIAFLTIGFAVLGPTTGRQIPQKEQDAADASVAQRRVDVVTPGDRESERAHQLSSWSSGTGEFMGKSFRHAPDGGFISYVMKVDPAAPMALYCTYWGNDGGGRRFDILIDDKVIATQQLNFNDPGRFFDVEYRIPEQLTRGKTNVTVVLQAYPRKIVGGVFGCQMLKR